MKWISSTCRMCFLRRYREWMLMIEKARSDLERRLGADRHRTKHVARPTHRIDLDTAASRGDLSPEARNEYFRDIRAHDAVLIRTSIESRAGGETGICASELDEHGALSVRELELTFGEPRIPRRECDAQRAYPAHAPAIRTAAKDRAHAREHLRGIARPRDDVIGAEIEQRQPRLHVLLLRHQE